MAGFTGYLNIKTDEKTFLKMMDKINHRGPDYRLNYSDEHFTLGFLGMDTEYLFDKQELYETDEHVVLLVGYLHNIDELRTHLIKKYNINAEDYVPVRLIEALYEKLGKDSFPLFKGSYLVVFYEKMSRKLTVLRDRFATQPIYYYPVDKGVIFGSELKLFLEHPAFKKELNKDALVPYLMFQAPLLDETFFKGAFTFAAASSLVFQDGNIEIEPYWDIHFEPKEMDVDTAANKINELVEKSIETKVKYYKDRKSIGSFLSGGVDSSYLASRFKPQKTFTVGYNDKEFSEASNAKALSKIIGAENISEIIDSAKSFDSLSDIAYFLDMPFANLSAVPMYFLSNRASQDVTTVLAGEGSDEFFGGYFEYTVPSSLAKYKRLPKFIRNSLGRKALNNPKDFKGKNLMAKGLPVREWYIGQAKVFYEKEANALVKDEYQSEGVVKKVLDPYFDKVDGQPDIIQKQYLDFHIWMVNDIALKADRMNMCHSIQVLAPLLDEDLLDFARTLPNHLKVDGSKVKIAFRHAAQKYLPEEWYKRKKLGFVVPMRNWLQEEQFSKLIKEKVTGELASQFFNVEKIEKLFELNASGKRAEHRKIWNIYMFILWYEEYFVKR